MARPQPHARTSPRESEQIRMRECSPRRDAWVTLMLFGLLVGIYHLNGDFLPGNDTKGSVYQAIGLLNHGQLSFTARQVPFMFNWTVRTPQGDFRASIDRWDGTFQGRTLPELYREGRLTIEAPKYYVLETRRTDPATGERLYINSFGPGPALLAVPLYAAVQVFAGDLQEHPALLWYGGKTIAALFVAGSGVFVFLTARAFLGLWPSLLLALAYGLGTCVWSTSSQALWQHGPNEFFLAMGTWLLLRAAGRADPGEPRGSESRPKPPLHAQASSPAPPPLRDVVGCALSYSAAVACRPTSIAVILVAAAFLLFRSPRAFLAFVLAALPIGLAMAAHNAYYLASPFTFGQTRMGELMALERTGSPSVWQTPFHVGLIGHLVSPSRGLLVFSPFLALAGAGMYLVWRRRQWAAFRPLTIAVALIFLVEIKHFDWSAGWSYGYRHIVDTTPLLAVLLIPALPWALRRRRRLALFLALVGWSVLVQLTGAFAFDVVGWNYRSAGYDVKLPGQEQTTRVDDRDEAQRLVATRGARLVRAHHLDIDLPENKWRLWSLRDNQIAYYLWHFQEARSNRKDVIEQWLSDPTR